MNSEEFPTLQESTHHNMEKSGLGSSWADVAKAEAKQPEEKSSPGLETSYAQIAGHEKKLSEEYPTLQESVPDSEPTSSGVADLIHSQEPMVTTDPIEPPNPDKSFADATANKGYPLPQPAEEAEQKPSSDLPPLSDLPDVKDMLEEPSVKVPVPPQSFASVAAKEVPPELRPLSERTQNVLEEQAKAAKNQDPLAVNDDNFPTLGQSNLMAQQHADSDEKTVYSEISRFHQAADMVVEEEEDMVVVDTKEHELKQSFANITASNMENAPPSAESHVDQHPVYDEDTVLLEKSKRELRKQHPVEYGNNNELIEQEKAQREEQVSDLTKKDIKEGKDRSMEGEAGDAYEARLQVFDKTHSGRITIFDTLFALYRLSYPMLTIFPAALLMHLQLSAQTSPYRFPFVYRSLYDIVALPIYTKNLSRALTKESPLVTQPEEKVVKMVARYGKEEEGLGYWDGLRAMRALEKRRWWQVGAWAVHRIQWTLTYAMMYDPSNQLVTTSTLISLKQHNQ
ncbi:hypothetical protein BY458DRAFT_503919 [Sporodiniella umbellata]|nr:hypothetical protein BY458DRAFT_503919 [Sporodiniella umbellata]